MVLRTRLDLFGAALLSALGATQLACGGRAATRFENSGGSSDPGAAGSTTEQGGSDMGGSSMGGASAAGSNTGGASNGGSAPSAGSAGAAGPPPPPNQFPCKNPKDQGNGLIECDGFVHRQAAVKCASHVPRADPLPNLNPNAACKYDAECTADLYGYCERSSTSPEFSYCAYGCVDNSDCGPGELCDCTEPVGRCVGAGCSTDADCASGYLCKLHDQSGGCGSFAFSCQSPLDTCGGDSDCPSSAGTQHCYSGGKTVGFQCTTFHCTYGRPFLVEGEERLARSSQRADWGGCSHSPCSAELDPALRRALAERWTNIALMEHASIAAFARFTLQLMQLGAPAALIELATAAMTDETKHAKACFAVASSYAEAPIGPGRLVIERSLDESSLEEIVLNAIRKGCVGETLAAVEAREAAEYAEAPALRTLLLEISEDETRHAELAYRFVQWALSLGGPPLERAVQREFAALGAQQTPAPLSLTDAERVLLQHGIVPEAMRIAIRGQAVAQIILPCARALTAPQPRAASTRSSAS